MNTGQYIRVSPDLELYYEEAGTGRPVVFVPGWAGTTEFFKYQMPYFSQRYRAITYDPRSQGRSSKTLENNHYGQHGHDLKAFFDALDLHDVVLVALSAGCFDVYAYVRAFGTRNLHACVFIDNPPCTVAQEPGDWCWVPDMAQGAEIIGAVMHDLRGFVRDLIPAMFVKELPDDELAWVLDQLAKTPGYAATLTITDYMLGDYTAEASLLDGQIPVLNIVAEADEAVARAWLKKHAPRSKVVALAKHLMQLEFPEEFNASVGAFLREAQAGLTRQASA